LSGSSEVGKPQDVRDTLVGATEGKSIDAEWSFFGRTSPMTWIPGCLSAAEVASLRSASQERLGGKELKMGNENLLSTLYSRLEMGSDLIIESKLSLVRQENESC
jgi:hypothetical protein